jgi:hypothetical protein
MRAQLLILHQGEQSATNKYFFLGKGNNINIGKIPVTSSFFKNEISCLTSQTRGEQQSKLTHLFLPQIGERLFYCPTASVG